MSESKLNYDVFFDKDNDLVFISKNSLINSQLLKHPDWHLHDVIGEIHVFIEKSAINSFKDKNLPPKALNLIQHWGGMGSKKAA